MSSTTNQSISGILSGFGSVSYTWATKPSAVTAGAGTIIRISDIGVNGETEFISDGAVWRLKNATDFVFDTTPVTGAVGTVAGNQLLKQWTVPAGLLTCCRYFSIKTVWYKSATSDTMTNRTRIGSNPSGFSDSQIGSNITISTTQRSFAAELLVFATSSTNIRMLGSQGGSSQVTSWPGAAAATAIYPTEVTVPDLDSAGNILSFTMSLTTGTDSSSSGLAHLVITGY